MAASARFFFGGKPAPKNNCSIKKAARNEIRMRVLGTREHGNFNLYRADGKIDLLEVGLADGLGGGEDQSDDAVGGGVGASAEHLQLQAAETHRLEGLGKVSRLFPDRQCFENTYQTIGYRWLNLGFGGENSSR